MNTPANALVALLLGASVASAQAPVMPLSAIPDTPAGNALREWFAAFNSGDSTTLEAYLHRYGSKLGTFVPMGFRRETGRHHRRSTRH